MIEAALIEGNRFKFSTEMLAAFEEHTLARTHCNVIRKARELRALMEKQP